MSFSHTNSFDISSASPVNPLRQKSRLRGPITGAASSEHGTEHLKFVAKSNSDFRAQSRREDAELLRLAFAGPTQDAMAKKGGRKLGVSPRTIINWMHCECDMPSWAHKRVVQYIKRIESIAARIEGQE